MRAFLGIFAEFAVDVVDDAVRLACVLAVLAALALLGRAAAGL